MIDREVPYVLVPFQPFAGSESWHYFLLDNLNEVLDTSEISCTLHMRDGSKIHAGCNATAMYNAISDARAAALNPIVTDAVPFRTAIDAYTVQQRDLREAGQEALLSALDGQPEGFGADQKYANTLVYWRAAVAIRRLANIALLYDALLSFVPTLVKDLHPLMLSKQHAMAVEYLDSVPNLTQAVQYGQMIIEYLRNSDGINTDRLSELVLAFEHWVPKNLKTDES
jgi:hypothetical protein